MRPSPADVPGRIRPLVMLLAVGLGLGCEPPTKPGRVRSLSLNVPATEMRPGTFMRVSALPLDADGQVVEGEEVRWRSMTPLTLAVTDDGLLLARAPGTGIARATVGQVHADLRIELVNPPIASLRVDAESLEVVLPGAPVRVLARAFDADGELIVAPPLAWESTAPRFATVDAEGIVTPVAVGRARVTVRAEGFIDTIAVRVAALAVEGAPQVSAIAPGAATPGASLTITGANFAPTIAGNTVLIDGTPVPVTQASTTQLRLAVPAASAFTCQPNRDVTLQVGTAQGIGTAVVALNAVAPRLLVTGQSVVLPSAGEARCNVLALPGRYLVTVPNAARTYGSGAQLTGVLVRGDAIGGAAPDGEALRIASLNAAAVRAAEARMAAAAPPRPLDRFRTARRRAREVAHANLLTANAAAQERARRLVRARAPTVRAEAGPTVRAALKASEPAVGSILQLRVPALELADPCVSSVPVGARVVHVTEHLAILEDTATLADGAATLAGQIDAQLTAIGDELESRGWPIATAFGDPLVADSRLDGNGRVMVLFTPRVNAKAGGGILAAVAICDFYQRALYPVSNVAEMVYAQVPTDLSAVMQPGSLAFWRYEMRAALVHELKHVTTTAERSVRGQPLEEPWLDEAIARQAEELYTRAAYGTVRFSNVGFAATLACELRANDPAYPECADAPRAMRPHVEDLWEYLAAPTARSPLGGPPGDFTFYGSGWALTRWLLDLDAPSEPAFFTALTLNLASGVSNLEGRSGRSWDRMLVEWSLAMLTDDLPGFVAQAPHLAFSSFDLRAVYQGYCDVVGSCLAPANSVFDRPWPVQPMVLQAGPFSASFPSIVPGGFAVLELVVPPGAGAQSIELLGLGGAPLPANVRLGIVRIQ